MALARLRRRVASAEFLGVYSLAGYDLRFHKIGQDGSAKCDAYRTGDSGHAVDGVVFDIDPAEVAALDRVEGVGSGYERASVRLIDKANDSLEAFTYFATRINTALRPFSWYAHHVLVGARSAGLSSPYIARIEAVVTVKDLDEEREARELRIHGV